METDSDYDDYGNDSQSEQASDASMDDADDDDYFDTTTDTHQRKVSCALMSQQPHLLLRCSTNPVLPVLCSTSMSS